MSTAQTNPASGLSQADWDRVHEQVQALFKSLADHVHRQLPMIRSEPARNAARAWFLHSYREFMWPDEDGAEAVIVGLSFAPSPRCGEIHVSGDICGEETGHIYHEVEERHVPSLPAMVVTAAQEMATQLSRQAEVVVNALRERRPPPNYRGVSQ